MNKDRRKAIKELIADLENARDRAAEIRDEETEYFDNMPEGIQMSERGEAAQEAVSNLEYAADGFDELIEYLENAAE